MKLSKILLEYPGVFTPRPKEEWEKNQEEVKRRTDPNYLIQNYIEKGSKGDLNLGDYSGVNADLLHSIPDNLTVRGSLKLFGCKNLIHLPKNLIVEDHLYLDYTGIERLHEDMSIGGTISAYSSKLKYIPDNFVVNENLIVSDCSNLTQLPKGLIIGGALKIVRTKIRTLPYDINITKHLYAAESMLERLPDNFTVNGKVDLTNCNKLKQLPNSLEVGSLLMAKTQVKEIPYNLIVHGALLCGETPLSYQNTKEEIEKMIEYKGGYVGDLWGGMTTLQKLQRDHYKQKNNETN